MTVNDIGDEIIFGNRHDNGDPIRWIVAHITEEGYGILVTWAKYKSMAFDAPEPTNPIEARKKFGNNRWSVSNIRQWLNSDKPATAWYAPMHEYDAVPDYVNQNGFLYNFSEEEKNLIVKKENITVVPKADKDGITDTTIDSVWLPSITEYFGSKNNGIMEGEQFKWFKKNNHRNTKYNPYHFPLIRSTEVDLPHCILYVGPYGERCEIAYPRNIHGIRPAIMVKSI